MKKPEKAAKAAGGKRQAEKPQGHVKGSGVNKDVVKNKVPQVRPGTTYGKPSQTQKL